MRAVANSGLTHADRAHTLCVPAHTMCGQAAAGAGHAAVQRESVQRVVGFVDSTRRHSTPLSPPVGCAHTRFGGAQASVRQFHRARPVRLDSVNLYICVYMYVWRDGVIAHAASAGHARGERARVRNMASDPKPRPDTAPAAAHQAAHSVAAAGACTQARGMRLARVLRRVVCRPADCCARPRGLRGGGWLSLTGSGSGSGVRLSTLTAPLLRHFSSTNSTVEVHTLLAPGGLIRGYSLRM